MARRAATNKSSSPFQFSLVFRRKNEGDRRGGARPGAGRPRRRGARRVGHQRRCKITRHTPVSITMRVRKGIRRSLRKSKQYRAIRRALHHVNHRRGFGVVEFSIQANHYHLIVEATSRRALSTGMQALNIRVAKALNAVCGTEGSVFVDRYHETVLKTPRHARNTLAYVLNNARRHKEDWGAGADWIDPCSSGVYFDGYQGRQPPRARLPDSERVCVEAKSWLLRKGWKKCGRIAVSEVPGAYDGWADPVPDAKRMRRRRR